MFLGFLSKIVLALKLGISYNPFLMTGDSYKQALQAAKEELAKLMVQKDEIDKRVARLRQTIVSLAALNEEINPEDGEVYVPSPFQRSSQIAVQGIASLFGKGMGFTDAVREVMKGADQPMSAMDVRDGLLRMGIDLESKYTNPLAVVAKTLHRLREGGEVRSATRARQKSLSMDQNRRRETA